MLSIINYIISDIAGSLIINRSSANQPSLGFRSNNLNHNMVLSSKEETLANRKVRQALQTPPQLA